MSDSKSNSSTAAKLIVALRHRNWELAEEQAMILAKVGDAHAIKPLIDYCISYEPAGGYRNDPNAPFEEARRAKLWVSPLEELIKRVSAGISSEDLRLLVKLNNKEFYPSVEYDTPGYGTGRDDFSVVLDFSLVRQLAKEELDRRGLS